MLHPCRHRIPALAVFLAPLLALAAALSVPAPAQAHSMFIQSARTEVAPGKSTPMFLCYGHRFPVDDGVRRAKLKSVRVLAPGAAPREMTLRDETCLHSYMIEYDQPGTWVLTAETNPGHYTKWTDKKGRSRSTIKPMSAIADKAASVEKSLYSTQYAKTYVACGQTSQNFPARVGLPLELVPDRDVFGLRQGQILVLQAYRDGHPYLDKGYWDATYTGFSTQPEDMYFPRREISGGRIELPLEHPGRWFIRFFIKTDAAPDKRDQYLQAKLTASLVIEVPNERIRPGHSH